jgi:hypothetical protein
MVHPSGVNATSASRLVLPRLPRSVAAVLDPTLRCAIAMPFPDERLPDVRGRSAVRLIVGSVAVLGTRRGLL